MGRLRGLAITAALISTTAIAPSTASAATEVGNDCLAKDAIPTYTLMQLAKAKGSALPATVPTAGVVTKWKVNAGALPFPMAERLRTFRATGNPNEFQTLGESAIEVVLPETPNVFETRVPVQAGDHVGLYAGTFFGATYCQTKVAEDQMGTRNVDAALNSAQTYEGQAGYQVAVVAVVEPDSDGDLFGDETQDKCPASGATQDPCPPVALGVFSQAGKGAATIRVSASVEAAVSVSGTANFTKAKRARASAKAKLRIVTKPVKPGEIVPFKLKFTKALKSALAATPRGKSLKLEVSVAASNIAGVTTNRDLVVKLRGRG